MNFYRPQKRKRAKMGVRESSVIRCAGHLKWTRGHFCCVSTSLHAALFECQGKTEAAHVRIGTDGGVGMKPGDCFVIPLCSEHHREQHQIGERSFETKYKISMRSVADQLWSISPHGKKYRLQQGERV